MELCAICSLLIGCALAALLSTGSAHARKHEEIGPFAMDAATVKNVCGTLLGVPGATKKLWTAPRSAAIKRQTNAGASNFAARQAGGQEGLPLLATGRSPDELVTAACWNVTIIHAPAGQGREERGHQLVRVVAANPENAHTRVATRASTASGMPNAIHATIPTLPRVLERAFQRSCDLLLSGVGRKPDS